MMTTYWEECNKNPHRGREHALMAAGIKRLAYFHDVDKHKLDRFDPALFSHKSFEFLGSMRWLVFRSEDEHLANQFIEVHRAHERGDISTDDAHRRCGELLGYDQVCIERFVRRTAPLA